MVARRVTAAVALVLFLAGVVVGVVEIVRDFPRGPVVMVLLIAGAVAAWQAVQRRGHSRHILLAGVVLFLVAAVVVVLTGERIGVGLAAVALLLAGAGVARSVFTVRVVAPGRRAAEARDCRVEPEVRRRQGRQQQPARRGSGAWDRADRAEAR